MTTQEAIQTIQKMLEVYTSECRTLMNYQITALEMAIEALTHFNAHSNLIKTELEKMMDELVIVDDNRHLNDYEYGWNQALCHLWDKIEDWSFESSCSEMPNRSEPLTDKEQRIFLSAMERERKVCKQVDEEWRDCREPYEDSLVNVCNEIERKVKGALWMI